ncbi:MAG: nitrogenase component 1, partial [Elusimicrobiota bacterium]
AAVEPVPGSVNLIGFPEGPALDELRALLAEAGVSVNARVMPAITMAQARGLRRAAAQVFLPNAAYEPVYEAVFGRLGLPGHVFEPPYGVEGTRRWLCSVAALFGREREAQAAFERAFAPMSEDWRALRGKALGRTMAFVADASHLPRLRDARLFWGVPAVRVLREMGFKVEVLLHGASDQGPVKGFTTPADLTRLLSAGDYGAVYSEFFYDERLVRAGKSQFSLAVFEPGLRGAAATLGRLLSAARWDFYRRYAPSLGGGKP